MARSALKTNYEILAGTLFEDFGTLGDWTPSPNNPSQLTVESGGLKVVSTSSSNNQQAIKTISKSFTTFVSFFVTPTSNVNYIVLGFSSQTSFASVYMNYQLSTTNMLGGKRNYVRIALSDFTATGGESFANTMIRMRVRVVSSDANPANAVFEDLRLARYHRPKIILQSDNVGSPSTIDIMYPILLAKGMKATLFVQSNLIDVTGKLTLANLHTLYNAGWDLGNHTVDHADLSATTTALALENVDTCTNFLNTNGFTRASKHIAYPLGATSDALNSVLQGAGYITGRKTTDKTQIVPPADFFKLDCYTIKAADSVATMKGYVDNAILKGGTAMIMTEGLANSSPSSQEVLTADYQALIDYIYLLSLNGSIEVVTISEWYNGLDGRRKIATRTPATNRVAATNRQAV